MHPSKEELSGFLLGKLPAEATEAVAHHIEQCPPCQETIVHLESDQDTLLRKLRQSAPPVPPPKPTGDESPTSSFVRPAPSSQPVAPAPTREQFIHNLGASGLIDEDEWNRLQREVPAIAQATDGAALVRALVEHGTLTKFQAAAIYQGKSQGLIFGEYVVLDLLGSGGMGQVFKARHRSMDRVVALKVLTKAAVDSPEAVKRFQREVKAAAKLHHPNIVIAHDASRQDGVHFLVMEYVEGSDLSALIKRDGPLPVEKAVSYIMQAARGLAFAHAEGVVHRDIKPANLLLDKKGVVKILDMGLARLDGDVATQAAGEGLTQTGQVMGTVDYMAPEQAFDTSRADAKADVYGLGCTLYRLLTGQSMFTGDTLMQKLLAHREQPIPSFSTVRPEVPAALDALYRRMVAKRPEDRPTAAEVVAKLEKVAEAELKTAGRDSGKKPPSRKLLAAGAAGFLLLCLGVWVVIRDKDGHEVGRMQVPPGGTAMISEEHNQRSDSNVPHRMKSTAESAPQTLNTNVDIVFLGNPIVVQWPVVGQSAWQRLASKWRIESLGNPIGNINALGRDLDEVRSRGWTPRAFVVSVGGTNKDHLADQWDGPADKYRDIIRRIGVNYPNAAIIVLPLIVDPAAPETSTVAGFHRNLNRAIRTFADERRVYVVDPNEVLFNSDGSLRPGLTTAPGITPTVLGYEKLTDAVEPLLTKLLTTATPSTDAALLGNNLLPLIQPQSDATGKWEFENGSLVGTCAAAPAPTTIWFSPPTPEEYDFEAEYGHIGDGAIVIGLVAGGHRFYVKFDLAGKYQAELGLVDGKPLIVKNPNSDKVLLTGGHRVRVSVRRSGIQARFDHQLVLDYAGDLSSLSRSFSEPAGLPGFLLRTTSAARFRKLTLTPAAPTAGPENVDVVFLGNNALQLLTNDTREVWKRMRARWRLQSLADAGRTIADLDQDMEQSVRAVGLRPHVFVISVGVNGYQAEHIGDGIRLYRRLVEKISKQYPQAKLVLMPTLINPSKPVVANPDGTWQDANYELNREVKSLADGQRVFIVDINELVRQPDGSLVPDLLTLSGGFTKAAYERWGESLEAMLMKLLPKTVPVALDGISTAEATKSGKFALHFDGKSGVTLPQLQETNLNAFCFEAFVTPHKNDPDVAPRGIISWPVSEAERFGLLIVNPNSKASWKAIVGAAPPAQTAQGTVRWDAPTHVAACDDGTELRLFVNGKSVATSQSVKQISFSKLQLELGHQFHGEMRQVRISKGARYSGEFTPPPLFESDADTVVLYRCDEGAGKVLHDASGHGYDATIVGAEWFRIDSPASASSEPAQAVSQRNMIEGNSAGISNGMLPAPPAAVAPFNAAQARAYQEAWAEYLGVRVEYENSIGMKFMLVAPGEFLMGSSDEQIEEILKSSLQFASPETEKKAIEDERPRHLVRITKPFYIGTTEVTNGDFSRFVEAAKFKTQAELDGGGKLYDPATRLSKTDPATNWRNPGYPFDSTLPVTQVTFNDCMSFCNWLSEKEELAPGYSLDAKHRSSVKTSNGYHLPTEAQWEYACRAGTMTIWYTGDQSTEIAAHRTSGKLQPVGLKLPNAFGLHDLYGSVHELCDDHSLEPFPATLRIDPRGGRVESRAVRGGHFMNNAIHCRSAHRHAVGVSSRDRTFGFRIVRELPLPATSEVSDVPKVKPSPSATEATKDAPPR